MTSAARFFAAGLEKAGLKLRHKGAYFNEFVVDASARPGVYDRLLEKDIGERRPAYRAYVARTNAFFPGPVRRHAD